MELTKEHFDNTLNNATKGLVTKEDVKNFATKEDLQTVKTELVQQVTSSQEELARMTAQGFRGMGKTIHDMQETLETMMQHA